MFYCGLQGEVLKFTVSEIDIEIQEGIQINMKIEELAISDKDIMMTSENSFRFSLIQRTTKRNGYTSCDYILSTRM